MTKFFEEKMQKKYKIAFLVPENMAFPDTNIGFSCVYEKFLVLLQRKSKNTTS